MIDGLKLTFSGEQLWTLLEERIRRHEESASRYTGLMARTGRGATGDASLLPPHVCEDEADEHTWRARVLAFIRDQVDTAETYRLTITDLEYCELLPEKPQEEELVTYDGEGYRATRVIAESGLEIIKIEREPGSAEGPA